ncbi:MAG: hypothetical protein PHO83_14775 [Geobacteraceae bacterium]|nr:hypothetical protein [Geobacteraceae bacterium]
MKAIVLTFIMIFVLVGSVFSQVSKPESKSRLTTHNVFKFSGVLTDFKAKQVFKGSVPGHKYSIIFERYGNELGYDWSITVIDNGKKWELSEQPMHGPDYASISSLTMPVGSVFKRTVNQYQEIRYPFSFKLKILDGKLKRPDSANYQKVMFECEVSPR